MAEQQTAQLKTIGDDINDNVYQNMDADNNYTHKFEQYWSKYPSIENRAYRMRIKDFDETAIKSTEWIATEKVHGANFCLMTDGVHVVASRRTGILGQTDKFYGCWKTILEKEKNHAIKVFEQVKDTIDSDAEIVMIFGELFGGYYNVNPKKPGYKDFVKKYKCDFKKIQNGVSYSPQNHFYPFDIKVLKKLDENTSPNAHNDNDSCNVDTCTIQDVNTFTMTQEIIYDSESDAEFGASPSVEDSIVVTAEDETQIDEEIDNDDGGNCDEDDRSYYLTFDQCENIFKTVGFEVYAQRLDGFSNDVLQQLVCLSNNRGVVVTTDELESDAQDVHVDEPVFDINTFHTTIPQRLQLPIMPDENTKAEGIIIRGLHHGPQVSIKVKNEKFEETAAAVKPVSPCINQKVNAKPKIVKLGEVKSIEALNQMRNQLMETLDKVELNDSSKKFNVVEFIEMCINENRLNAAISKVGELELNTYHRISGLFTSDVWNELVKENEAVSELEATHKKMIKNFIKCSVERFVAPIVKHPET